MSVVHYQIWEAPAGSYGMDYPEHVRTLIASGSINLADTISPALAVPTMRNGGVPVAVFRVAGNDERAYVAIAPRGTVPTGTGAHAASDAIPRVLLLEQDGFVRVPVPVESSIAVVRAAAIA